MILKPHPILLPFAILYGAAVQARNRLYDWGALASYSVAAPVISVGNLTVGGTGKTPFVLMLLDLIRKTPAGARMKTGVVSRGYRGAAREYTVVSDGRRVKATPEVAGDEPVMLAENAPGTVVVVDPNRARGAGRAIEELKVQLVILDDGFQHRRLKRDLDIVLLDEAKPLGNRLLLPAGYLREPVSSLKRADLIVLSKAHSEAQSLEKRVAQLSDLFGKPVIATRMTPRYWRKVGGGELLAADEIKGRSALAFAGLASPQSFFQTVRDMGAERVVTLPFPDHCKYTKAQLDYLSRVFIKSKVDWLVTTAKDAVKLPVLLRFLPAYYLESRMEVAVGGDILDKALAGVLEKLTQVER